MARYQETLNPDYVLDTSSGAYVPRQGTYQSDAFNAWLADGHVVDPMPSPSVEDVATANALRRRGLLSAAAIAIAPLQDAVDLGMASDDERVRLASWKTYRVDVNRVDVTLIQPAWPTPPKWGQETPHDV